MAEHGNEHFLDVDKFEVARSIHRIVRGMHDGECPKCHYLSDSEKMRSTAYKSGFLGHVCPHCYFAITDEEAQLAMQEFGPVMDKNLAVFEDWRGKRKADTNVIPAP